MVENSERPNRVGSAEPSAIFGRTGSAEPSVELAEPPSLKNYVILTKKIVFMVKIGQFSEFNFKSSYLHYIVGNWNWNLNLIFI